MIRPNIRGEEPGPFPYKKISVSAHKTVLKRKCDPRILCPPKKQLVLKYILHRQQLGRVSPWGPPQMNEFYIYVYIYRERERVIRNYNIIPNSLYCSYWIHICICACIHIYFIFNMYNIVQLLSCVWLFVTPWTVAPPSSPVLHYLPDLTQIHVHWVSDAL